MNEKEIDALINSNANKKYEYFVKKVADFEEVWGLYNNGWAMVEGKDGKTAIPFWPQKEYAKICSKDDWIDYLPKSIDLGDFLQKWIPGLRDDSIDICLFYTQQDNGIIIDGEKLTNDLYQELENY